MSPPNRTTDQTIPESIRVGANALLAGVAEETSSTLAAAAVHRLEELARYLAQLVGELGVRALFARSVADARTTHPWLVTPPPAEPPWVALRAAMERQDPRAIRDGFVGVLSTFGELLARLIGEGLVRRLLHELWPGAFPQVAKETM